MNLTGRKAFARAAAVVSLSVASLALMLAVARAQDKTYVMKISTPTINASPDLFARKYAAAVEKASGGRIKGEVYPASQLGSIPRQIEGTQFGAIQCEVVPPEFMVGLDERFEIMAAPGLIDSIEHGQRLAADAAVLKLMLSLGVNKGLHGVGLFMGEQSQILTKTPVRRLADFKGKKLRIFASRFQSEAMQRLGVTPVAMSLGDVLPAIQQGAIDGAVAGVQVFTGMHFYDASKFITMTNQPAIFLIVEINRAWYDSLPADLQQIVDREAAKESVAINPEAIDIVVRARKGWLDKGGELIDLPRDEQATFIKTLSSVGDDVSKASPSLAAAYKVVTDAAGRTR